MASQQTILPFTSFSAEVQEAYTEEKVAIMQQYGFSRAVIQENALKKLRRSPCASFSYSSTSASSSLVAPPQQQQIQQIAAESAQLAMGVTPGLQEYPFTFTAASSSFSPGFAGPHNNNIMGGVGFPMNDLLASGPGPATSFLPSFPDIPGGYQAPMPMGHYNLGFSPMGFSGGHRPYNMVIQAPVWYGGGGLGLQGSISGYMSAPVPEPSPPVFSGVPQPLTTPPPMPTGYPVPANDFPLFPPPPAIDAETTMEAAGAVHLPQLPVLDRQDQLYTDANADMAFDEFLNFNAVPDLPDMNELEDGTQEELDEKQLEFCHMLEQAIAEMDARAGDTGYVTEEGYI